MLRQGEISPSLARFRSYRLHAEQLEDMKSWPRAASDAQAYRRSVIASIHESKLDRAWSELEVIATWYGDLPAQVISEHYLFCHDWHDISAELGIPYDKLKKLAYRTLVWLDVWVAAFGEGNPRRQSQ